MTRWWSIAAARPEDGALVEDDGDAALALLAWGPFAPGQPPTARLVADAIAGAVDRTPAGVLAAIDRAARDHARLITAAAVRWRDDSIDLAWIGDVRAHLIRDARVIASTRDHTIASDRGLLDAPPVLARATSRALGGPDARWDETRWQTDDDDVLLLCGPDLHDFAAPDAYLARALDRDGPTLGRVVVGRRADYPRS